MNKKMLQGQNSVTLIKWLEALFSANNTLNQMYNSVETISKNEELNIPQSFVEKQKSILESKVVSNNNAIREIEKLVSERMKKVFPSIFVFNDIDIQNQKISDAVDDFSKKEKKGLKKT